MLVSLKIRCTLRCSFFGVTGKSEVGDLGLTSAQLRSGCVKLRLLLSSIHVSLVINSFVFTPESPFCSGSYYYSLVIALGVKWKCEGCAPCRRRPSRLEDGALSPTLQSS